MRRSGRGRPSPMRRAMDQMRRLAPSMSPPMLPVVSSTNATSTRGPEPAAGIGLAATVGREAARARASRTTFITAPPALIRTGGGAYSARWGAAEGREPRVTVAATVARIDLNADVGESYGSWRMGADAELLPLVTSINVACGFHAGDPEVMDRTVALAVRAGVALRAHPGHPDLRGFGRRALQATADEIERDVLYQVGALQAFARAHGTRVVHVKPHGALYNQAAEDETVA